MREYIVKGMPGIETRMRLLQRRGNGYDVKIESRNEYGVRESREYIEDHLLECCLRTGYLTEVKENVGVGA
jgi:hypothetical protein